MDKTKSLKRYFQTRRCTGRRSLTPMKSKHKKSVPKTRGHKVEKKPHVPIRKHSGPQQSCRRETTDTQEYSENTEWKGNQDSSSNERWENEKEYTQIEQGGNTENSEKPVHPGPVQAVSQMPECADDTQTSETSIEAEELP
jgi:hypothetical protein